MTEPDLRHHGDAEIEPGLVDLAVNVRAGTPPEWLRARLADSLAGLAAYPRPDSARAAVAARHGRRPAEVLLTAGAAEAFTLIARAFSPRHAVVVHPQFTEPEAALLAAGHRVERVLLAEPFVLDPALVKPDADLVVVGNPTNPTSVLHPAATLAALARPGRILVVDEAFMDAVPGEPESLAGSGAAGSGAARSVSGPAAAPGALGSGAGGRRADLPGLIVVRSLTKTWGLAGLRVGYVLAAPELIDALASVQPHWSVSSPALVAAEACSTPSAVAEAAAAAREVGIDRAYLVRRLAELGVRVAAEPRAPFVLAHVPGRGAPGGAALRLALRAAGFAVRRGDTFPGLGPDWLRLAVRDAATTDALIEAWRAVSAAAPASAR